MFQSTKDIDGTGGEDNNRQQLLFLNFRCKFQWYVGTIVFLIVVALADETNQELIDFVRHRSTDATIYSSYIYMLSGISILSSCG